MQTDSANVLSVEQQKAFNILENTNENIFLTGKAGTGKSHLINYFIQHTNKKVAVLAPTGIAAVNISGQTINSFFGILEGIYYPTAVLAKLNDKPSTYGLSQTLQSLQTIIIDEVSMVRADLFHTMDLICRTLRNNPEFFGGIQLILVGDLFQLPPVVTSKEIREELKNIYKGPYFFNAPDVLKNIKRINLTEVFRQDDTGFKSLLDDVREGKNIDRVLSVLNQRVMEPDEENQPIVIASTNDEVDNINNSRLDQLEGEEFTYSAHIIGDFPLTSRPTETELRLKVGAQVMMLNNDYAKRWVNGTVGKVTKLTERSVYVTIDGVEYDIDLYEWTLKKYKSNGSDQLQESVSGSFIQFPIRLAWAVTVHKSQGQTYDSVAILISRAFSPGQTYVALSRCKSLDKLYLKQPLKRGDIFVSPEILRIMQ